MVKVTRQVVWGKIRTKWAVFSWSQGKLGWLERSQLSHTLVTWDGFKLLTDFWRKLGF